MFVLVLSAILSPSDFCNQLLREINRTSGGVRFRRQADPKPYIAAFFKELPTEFTLGDNKMYGDFENKQLLNGHEYIFFVLAVLEISENVSFFDIRPHPHAPPQSFFSQLVVEIN